MTSTAPWSSRRATLTTCGTPAKPGASPGSVTPPAPTARRGNGKAISRSSRPNGRGRGRRDVPPRPGRRPGEAVPDVVLRGRAIRAERHRLRHQSRWADVGAARPEPDLPARAQERLGEGPRNRLPGGQAGRMACDVLYRL